jgi:hypothetical protein
MHQKGARCANALNGSIEVIKEKEKRGESNRRKKNWNRSHTHIVNLHKGRFCIWKWEYEERICNPLSNISEEKEKPRRQALEMRDWGGKKRKIIKLEKCTSIHKLSPRTAPKADRRLAWKHSFSTLAEEIARQWPEIVEH